MQQSKEKEKDKIKIEDFFNLTEISGLYSERQIWSYTLTFKSTELEYTKDGWIKFLQDK